MAKPLFHGLEIAVSGHFGQRKSHEDIKRWVEAHGGAFKSSVRTSTTHLVVTNKCWLEKTEAVVEASKTETIKIVTFDWLEDSIRSKRCRSEKPYLWTNIEKQNASMKQAASLLKSEELRKKVRAFLKKQRQLNVGEKLDGFQTCLDTTGFPYNIILVRPDVTADIIETIQIQLLERTNGPPYSYATMATYKDQISLPIVTRLTPMACQFQEAFTQWKKLFKSRTGVPWEYRLWGAQRRSLWATEKMDNVFIDPLKGQVGTIHEPWEDESGDRAVANYFQYYLPLINYSYENDPVTKALLRRLGPPPRFEVVGGSIHQFCFDRF